MFGRRHATRLLAICVTVALWTGLSLPLATPVQAAGQFQSLATGFTQNLYGLDSGFLGGVAFASNGDPVADNCWGSGGVLHRWDHTSTLPPVHGATTVHPESTLASAAGCGLTNHPNGSLYTNTSNGVVRLDANTGAQLAGPYGLPGDALGITVDPVTGNVVYVESNGVIGFVNPGFTTNGTFSTATSGDFVDGIFFDPSGNFLFMSNRAPTHQLTIVRRDGSLVQNVPMSSEPDGIAFHSVGTPFVVTNNTDGTMTRFDFPGNDFTKSPTQSQFAAGGFRGDLTQVGPDGCLYITQAGTRYDDGTTDGNNSLVQICPGFAPPPGVACNTTPASSSDADVFAADLCQWALGQRALTDVEIKVLTELSNLPQVLNTALNTYAVPALATLSIEIAVLVETLKQALQFAVDKITKPIQDLIAKGIAERILGGEIPCAVDAMKGLLDSANSAAQGASETAKAVQTLGNVVNGQVDGAVAQDITGAGDQEAQDLMDAYSGASDAFNKAAQGCFLTQGQYEALALQLTAARVVIVVEEQELSSAYGLMGEIAQGGYLILGQTGAGTGLPVVGNPEVSPLPQNLFPPNLLNTTNNTVIVQGLPPLTVNTNIVNQGAAINVTGTNLPPLSSANLLLGSEPVRLATVTTDSSGSFSTTVQIPTQAAPGAHELFAVTTTGAGSTRALAAAITVNPGPGPQAPGICTGSLSGRINGTLTVAPNMVCTLTNAVVEGSVMVQTGAIFEADRSTIDGGVTATSPTAFLLCGDRVDGRVVVQASAFPALIGGADSPLCAVTTVTGGEQVT